MSIELGMFLRMNFLKFTQYHTIYDHTQYDHVTGGNV